MSLFGKPSVAKLKAKGDRAGLAKSLSEREESVRREAAEALGSLGWTPETDKERLDFLVASETWAEVAEFGRAKPELLVERFLGEARYHPGEKVGVGGMPLTGGQMELGSLATPSGEDVRCSLVSALREVGESAVPSLVTALDSEDADRGSHASWALVEIGEATLEPLIDQRMPSWSQGSFDTRSMGTVALAAMRARERGGQGFVAHLRLPVGAAFDLQIPSLVAGLAGEGQEFAAWQDDLIDRSLDQGPDTLSGTNFTLTLDSEELARKIVSDQDTLRTTLEQLPDFNAKVMLRALLRGRRISREMAAYPPPGRFPVKVTLLPVETQDSAPGDAPHATEERDAQGADSQPPPPDGATRPAAASITMRAADEQMATNLISDPYFLFGALTDNGSNEARAFLAAMPGGTITHEVSRDPSGSGFIVKLTVQAAAQGT